jgi:hypothetical protein
MNKQQLYTKTIKTFKASLRERERVNNARGIFDFLTKFLTNKHYFNGAFLLSQKICLNQFIYQF